MQTNSPSLSLLSLLAFRWRVEKNHSPVLDPRGSPSVVRTLVTKEGAWRAQGR